MCLCRTLKFYDAKQSPTESINEWLARLKSLTKNCQFAGYLENVIRDKFVCGLTKGVIFDRVSEMKKDAPLKECIEVAVQKELTQRQKTCAEVFHLSQGRKPFNKKFAPKLRNKKAPSSSDIKSVTKKDNVKNKALTCYACGERDHDFKSCQYKKYRCKLCKQIGHLAKMCKSGQTNHSLDVVSSEEHEIHGLYNISDIVKNDFFLITLKLNGLLCEFEVDTGSAVSVCSEDFYNKHFKSEPLHKVNTVLKTYNSELIQPLGYFVAQIEHKEKTEMCNILVIPNGGRPLIGRDVLNKLNPNLKSVFVNQLDCVTPGLQEILMNFEDIFRDELGCYKFEKINIGLKELCSPVFCKPRPVPLAFQEKFKVQLNGMVVSGMLKKIEFSQWGTPLVPVLKKDGDLRICADYKSTVNPFVKDFKFSLPLIEDMFAALNGGVLFSKLDMRNAYNQLLLDDESQLLLAWSTQEGLFAPTRLPFGISPACSIFQSIMCKTLQGCNGVICFLDDILVTGANNIEHLNNLKCVFERLREAGFRLKRDKCSFFQTKVNYLGYIVDRNGLHKDPAKIAAMVKAPTPSTATQSKAFVGLVGYYARFIPNMAQILSPVYKLLQQDTKFIWNDDCERSFKQVKDIIASEKVLVHFNHRLPIKLKCDAANNGIGAAIFHVMGDETERPIAFALRR